MAMNTYPIIIKDGHVYTKVTLRDVVEKCDVSDLPILSEVKRLYDENAKLRTALSAILQCNGITKRDKGCDACPMYDKEKEYVWAGDWCGIKQFICELGIEGNDA